MTDSKRNGHGHITETPDVSHIKNIDVTHEASDVSISGILKFVIGLTVFAVVVHILMWGLFRFFNAQEQGREPQPGPMAMTEQERRPPDPKLQSAPGFGVKLESGQWVPLENREPQAEYSVLSAEWRHRLDCSQPDNESSESAHEVKRESAQPVAPCVPIDAAIDKVVKDGSLKSRVNNWEQQPGTRAEDYGLDMPTAASSGRMTEKRRQ